MLTYVYVYDEPKKKILCGGEMFSILLGVAASFFFAFTFLLNKEMALGGGSWLWSSSLRFWFMLPLLLLLVASRGQLRNSLRHLRSHIGQYLLWSTIGFGFFYAPLTLSAAYAPSWLVAGCWQITIIAGPLMSPWISGSSVPWRSLRWSLLILVGIVLMVSDQISSVSVLPVLSGFGLVLFAAFAYPLGNRKMMAVCDNQIDTFQRVLNMTIASLPFWFCISVTGLLRDGFPDVVQIKQSFYVAVFSGVVATLLFFAATQKTRHDTHKLAGVEATQSAELIFTLLGEVLIIGAPIPSSVALIGIVLVVAGMLAHSLFPGKASGQQN
ncbi:TPA: multidrug resistance efflux transporter family protein [Enterobacter cancerogenus]